jgi:hypothetical protein
MLDFLKTKISRTKYEEYLKRLQVPNPLDQAELSTHKILQMATYFPDFSCVISDNNIKAKSTKRTAVLRFGNVESFEGDRAKCFPGKYPVLFIDWKNSTETSR